MERKSTPGALGGLAKARQCFGQWRRDRKRQRRIPDHLWRMAGEAASIHGLCATARCLRLNPTRLKKWLPSPVEVPALPEGPRFVELPWAGAVAVPECILEAEGGDGSKLRIHLKGEATAQVVSLGRMLWKE